MFCTFAIAFIVPLGSTPWRKTSGPNHRPIL